MQPTVLQPTLGKERILALDFLRGFALLGILLINIQSFSMPGAAYLNPSAYGDLSGANKWVWILSHVLGDQKFMTIFSILFGAGIVLVTQKAEVRTGRSAGLHYKRSFWLLVFGLIHAHLIWHGDILVAYAVCALFAYLFRKKSPRNLMIIGLLLISVHSIFYIFLGTSLQNWPPEALEGAKISWIPSETQIQEEIAAVTGSLSEQISHNSEAAIFMEIFVFLFIFLWRAGGLMLVGMALYKWGVLSATRSTGFYRKAMFLSWLIGFPIVIYGVYRNFQADWSFEFSMYLGSQFNYWGSLFVSFGYICAMMLIAQSNALPWLKDRIAAVGQMAFSNYIAQSIICVFLFWGIGLAWFGEVNRTGQIMVVLVVWIMQILWSRPWLNNFRFGPLEWIWRTLSYGKRQPFLKTN